MIYITHYHSYNTKFRRPTLSNVYVGFDKNETRRVSAYYMSFFLQQLSCAKTLKYIF
jgi:hypothetical protein